MINKIKTIMLKSEVYPDLTKVVDTVGKFYIYDKAIPKIVYKSLVEFPKLKIEIHRKRSRIEEMTEEINDLKSTINKLVALVARKDNATNELNDYLKKITNADT